MTGLVIGVFSGTVAAIVVELATANAGRLITLAGALIGIAVGSAVEFASFLRRKRARRVAAME